MDNRLRYWYGPRYLFGQRVAQTWQGWLADGVGTVLLLSLSPLLRRDSQHPLLGLGLMFGMLAVWIAIRSWKGEPRRWDD
jgi:hypothetical protein